MREEASLTAMRGLWARLRHGSGPAGLRPSALAAGLAAPPDDARPAEMLTCACRPSRSPSGARSPRRQVVGGSFPEPLPAAARAVSSSSPYHLRRYSQPCMSPAATSSMPFRFSVVVSVMMLSSKPTRTFQVEFLIRQGCPLHADVDFPFGPASDCVCGTSATVKLHVLPRYGDIFHYSYQIMRKTQIMDYNDQYRLKN